MPPLFRIFTNLSIPSALTVGTRLFPQLRLRSSCMSTASPLDVASVTFPVSPVPKNLLGEGSYIRTAGALIMIGDEILNGKTLDRNSHFFAKYCFEHGVELYRQRHLSRSQKIFSKSRLFSMQ